MQGVCSAFCSHLEKIWHVSSLINLHISISIFSLLNLHIRGMWTVFAFSLVCGNSLADWVMRCWICVCCDCIPYLESKTLRDSAVPLLLGMGRYQEQISITRVPYVYGRFLQVELSTCQRQFLHKGLIPIGRSTLGRYPPMLDYFI